MNHVHKSWSNDLHQLESISGTSFRGYTLDPPALPILVSDATTTPRRYLISDFGKFYFWIPLAYEILYVTECITWKASCSASMTTSTSYTPRPSNHLLCSTISNKLHTFLYGSSKFLTADYKMYKS